jgi:hypothetical protein
VTTAIGAPTVAAAIVVVAAYGPPHVARHHRLEPPSADNTASLLDQQPDTHPSHQLGMRRDRAEAGHLCDPDIAAGPPDGAAIVGAATLFS